MTKEEAQINLDRLYSGNRRYTLQGEYIGSSSKIETKCNKCEHVWHPYYNNLMDSRGCPVCSRVKVSGEHLMVSDYFVDGFIPPSYNLAMKPIAVFTSCGEMATLRDQKSRLSKIPLIF